MEIQIHLDEHEVYPVTVLDFAAALVRLPQFESKDSIEELRKYLKIYVHNGREL